MNYENYLTPLVYSFAGILLILILRSFLIGLVKKFAIKYQKLETRTKLVIKHINLASIFTMLLIIFMIWGIDFQDIGIVFSSVFAVIGVAFFAQWSILSNVTSGLIMFFTFPFKIGDRIKIHDKDFTTETLSIEDIRTFQLVLRTDDGALLTYPNSLILQKGVTLVSASVHPFDNHPEDGTNKNVSESID